MDAWCYDCGIEMQLLLEDDGQIQYICPICEKIIVDYYEDDEEMDYGYDD